MERYPNLKEEAGGLIPSCEISSLLDIKLVRWSTASYALALACRHSVSNKKKKKQTIFTFSVGEASPWCTISIEQGN